MTKLRTTGCFLHLDDKFLILHRLPHKAEGGTWGLPAGKVNAGESDLDAIMREVFEETGYMANQKEFEFLGDFKFNFDDLQLNFPTFRINLRNQIEVNINPEEHQNYLWVTGQECHAKPNLIHGFHELLEKTGYA